MQKAKTSNILNAVILVVLLVSILPSAIAQPGTAPKIPQSALIQPADFAKVLQGPGGKPLILNIGPRMLYAQAHIPGAEFIGGTSTPDGIQKLRQRLQFEKKNHAILLYCGCCPWEHCPNVDPAYEELKKLGFTNVKVLYLANNFGADWVYKGLPTAKGD